MDAKRARVPTADELWADWRALQPTVITAWAPTGYVLSVGSVPVTISWAAAAPATTADLVFNLTNGRADLALDARQVRPIDDLHTLAVGMYGLAGARLTATMRRKARAFFTSLLQEIIVYRPTSILFVCESGRERSLGAALVLHVLARRAAGHLEETGVALALAQLRAPGEARHGPEDTRMEASNAFFPGLVVLLRDVVPVFPGGGLICKVHA